MMNSSLIPDQAIRDRALSPAHSFIVQAPAGSGKTELLTQRYLRLLATVKQPEHILAITFTRKAASEMSHRILKWLQTANDSPRPEKEHEAKTWELARAALERDQQHQWNLFSNPSRLRIQTIDALNNSLARRLPILSGTGAAFEIATDADALYEAAANKLLQQLGDGSDVSTQLEVVLQHMANRVPELLEMLVNLLARRDHWLPLVKYHDADYLRASMENTLREAVGHHLRLLKGSIPVECHGELVELVGYAANNRLQSDVKAELEALLHACSTLTELPGTSDHDVIAWRGMNTVLCTKEGDFYKKVDKRHGFPADNKEIKNRFEALLNALRDVTGLSELFAATHTLPAASYSDSQWRVLSALLCVLPQAAAHLKVEFQQSGKIDFVEVALRARDALGSDDNPTDLALSLDMRLQHILVDEFQDTSITQKQLLQLLTAGWMRDDGRTLFCVGDPMQSIYRFRQAEVGLFLDMQVNGLPTVQMESLQLQTNFRSSRPVIDWINAQFPYVLPAHNDSEQGAVSYSRSECRPDASTSGGVFIHPVIARSNEQEARDIVDVVRQSLGDEELSDEKSRVAILVSGRSHVGAIANELSNAGIAYSAVEIETLKDRSLIQDLLALMRALLHPGDRIAWLACLRAPWCGLTLKDLHAFAGDEPDECIWTLLNTEAALQGMTADAQLRVKCFIPIMQCALEERGRYSLRDWVQRCWLALSGPALLQEAGELHDANAFFTLLDEVEEAGDLSDFAQLEVRLEKLFAAPVNSDKARVEIMTIHKSKGLEFDVVIIPSMHRKSQGDNAQLLRWAQLTGLDADGLVLSPPQPKGSDNDAIHQWLKQLEQQRTDLERGRVLYVAATRAKRALHLFGSVDVNSKDEITPPRKGTLLKLLWHAVSHEFEHCQRTAINHAVSKPVLNSIRRLPLDWQMPPVAIAVTGVRAQQNIELNDEPIEFDWVSETSRHVGTVIHAELEALMNAAHDQQAQWDIASRRALITLMLAERGIPETLREQACDRVVMAIENTLKDHKGRWLMGMENDIRDAGCEVELSGVINGTVINCVLDRTFIDDKGTRWIIDFKTSTHEGGDLEFFLQSEELRYRHQLQRYAKLMQAWKPEQVVRTALYFPLMQQWREVATI